MLENLALKTKILSISLASLLFLIAIGVVSLTSIEHLNTTNDGVRDTHSHISTSLLLEKSVIDMETGMRGFLLAGENEFLSPYREGNKKFNELIDQLKKLVKDNPKQLSLLSEIETLIVDWQANVAEHAINLRTEIGDAETMNDMAASVGEARGKRFFDKFRQQLASFIQKEQLLIKERQEKLENSQSLAEYRDAMVWVSHTYQVIAKAQTILSTAIDMETGMRGYLLAGKEEFLEPYQEGKNRFFILVEDLKSTVSDNPSQVSLLGEISSTIETWNDTIVEQQIELRNRIGHAKTMDDMADLIAEARGKTYIDSFRIKMTEFRNNETATLNERISASNNSITTTHYSIIIGIALAILVVIPTALTISNSIINPLKSIFQGLNSFSGKELQELHQVFGKLISKMEQSSKGLSHIAQNITSASQNLSQISNRQASSVEETSASTEEISGMVKENVQSAEQSRNLSNQMGDKMAELNQAMNMIADSNQKIEELVKIIDEIGSKTEIIDEIVFQTKLLSFNASVEAERAGEHGRGFAVVAQEVGNLAKMSGRAATDISNIVKKSVNEAEQIAKENSHRVQQGNDIAKETKTQSSLVVQGVTKIFEASNEQARGIIEISHAVESINKATQHAASIADQASGYSHELQSQAEDLNRIIQNLNGFLKGNSEINESVIDQPIELPAEDEHLDDNTTLFSTQHSPLEKTDGHTTNLDAWNRL